MIDSKVVLVAKTFYLKFSLFRSEIHSAMPEAIHVSYTSLKIKDRVFYNQFAENIVFISETKVIVEIKRFKFHSFMTCLLTSMLIDFEFRQREKHCII